MMNTRGAWLRSGAWRARVAGAAWLLAAAGEGRAMAAAAPEDAVAATLRRACVSCHGPSRRAGGLRLDNPAGLRATVTPGDAQGSQLIRRLRGLDGEQRMPAEGPALPAAEIERIVKWIQAGAPGLPPAPGHWAYLPPRRPPLPAVSGRRWVRNEIDRFVLARLERAGLRPSPEASPAALIRRVTLDLTGLPPMPAELDAFTREARHPGAYERLVDRLLASPHHGERWAVPWLDAARYADSNGHEKDRRREIWRYRDWVVSALNDDMPHDRFTLEQIAGDLLPEASTGSRIATGFHRNSMVNEEGGVDAQEARWEALVDRASTTATVWLGSTLGCAQCHDHKHDPFSQRDFFGLLAFFEQAQERTMALPTAAQGQRLAALEAERRALSNVLGRWTPALGQAQRLWERELTALPARWRLLDRVQARGPGGRPLESLGDGSFLDADPSVVPGEQIIEGLLPAAPVTGLRLEVLPHARLPGGGPGRSAQGNFLLSALALELAPPGGAFSPVPLARVVADEVPRIEPERYGAEGLLAARADQGHGAGDDSDDLPRGWGVFASEDQGPRLPRQLVVVPRTPLAAARGARLRVRLRYGPGTDGERIGRPRLWVTSAPAPERIVALSPPLGQALLVPEALRPRKLADQLAARFRELTPLLEAQRRRLADIATEEAALAVNTTLVMAPGGAARTVLRQGGSFSRPGAPIPAAVPAVLRTEHRSTPAPADRLALGRWLGSAANPLGARVLVNRLWAEHFGRGLVDTAEDFGTQGTRPSHPELLDWLATEVVRQRYRPKALHRLIVTSATYRQSSTGAADDRRQRLLARMPRLRLGAEMVKDTVLAIAGRLDLTVGGPPVFPPQPPGVAVLPNSTETAWPDDRGQPHRRALYTFWRRSAPYPSAQLFDAPSRESCVVRRIRTETPLQALATLNDEVFWDAALGLAERMLREPPPDSKLSGRLQHGFRLATGRTPDPRETRLLADLVRRQQRRQPGAGAAAESGTGEAPSLSLSLALTLAANVILNLDETLSRP